MTLESDNKRLEETLVSITRNLSAAQEEAKANGTLANQLETNAITLNEELEKLKLRHNTVAEIKEQEIKDLQDKVDTQENVIMKYKHELMTEISEADEERKEMTKQHEEEIAKLKTNFKEAEAKWKADLDTAIEAAEQVVLHSEFLKIKSELEQEIKLLSETAKEMEAKLKKASSEKQLSDTRIGKLELDLVEKERINKQLVESPRVQTAVRKVYDDSSSSADSS